MSALDRLIVGGAAVPRSMLEGFDRHDLKVVQAWGMTELAPLGTVGRLPRSLDDSAADEQYAFRGRQGIASPFVDIRARDDDGQLIAWDDVAMGELEVRGPWVAAATTPGRGTDSFTADGWFKTGDVVRIDAFGCIRICDRSKDLVKSGGEWISSVDLENSLMCHPAIAQAAVIAIPDERWGERPLAVVSLCDGGEASPDELREHLGREFAKIGECRTASSSSQRSHAPPPESSRRPRCETNSQLSDEPGGDIRETTFRQVRTRAFAAQRRFASGLGA